MTIKTILFASVIALAPAISFAMCSKEMHETTASSCASGQVWDIETELCVDIVTG